MKLKRCILALVAMLSSFALTTYALVAMESESYVAKIGDVTYDSFSSALTAANAMSGDVTVEIYGSVEFVDGMELKGNYTSINFVGKDSDAQMTINQTAGGDYLEAHGKTVTFTDLSLVKANPAWAGNSGHMGSYFSIQGGIITYNACTFPNGACTSGGTATYNDCTFQNASEYGLWVYDDALVTVDGGTFDSKKGIKVYSEDETSVTTTLTVKNATFTENVTDKPAVAVGYAQSITLIGNTYNNPTAHVELDSGSDADCEGVTFVAEDAEGNDIASTLKMTDRSNSQAACGVLVDGKVYTSVTTAAAEATAGSNVTVLYSTDDTVEFAEGVNLTLADGVVAENVTVVGPVAKIGENSFASFAEALTAASEMSGDVTVEIYGKVTLNSSLSGSYSSIKFVGKDTDAEIYLEVQGYITATGKTVTFEDLKLSKSAGEYITNAGFMNVAFGVYDVTAVNYNNCTFTNGAYASSGTVTFTGCTFYRSYEKYGLWAYGDVDVTVDDCTFADYRGIKMYTEGAARTVDLTVKNTDFSALTGKPAIVLTYGESVTLEGNTYSDTGVFELDLDGAPNGTAVTSDVAPTCKNDNGACGVLVDGKIYTTVAEAAAVATSGSTITLLHNSTETVQLPEGVTLDKNGFTADGVTEAGPTEVATFEELVAALANGGEIKLTADIEVDAAITAVDGTVIDLNGQTLSVNVENSYYNNVSIKNGNIVLGKDDVHVCDGYFLVNEGKTLNLTDVNVSSSAEGIKGYAVFHLKTGANLDLINCQLNISNNEYTAGYIVYAGESTATLDVTNTTITGSQVNGVVHATTVIENSTVTLTDVIEHGINRSATTIDDSNVTISGGTGRGITAQHGDLVITGNSVVNISEMGEATIELRSDKNLTIAETATVTIDAEVNNTTNGTITGTVTVELPVAKIGETSYASLADAIAAAAAGDTVTILAGSYTTDVTVDKAITLMGETDAEGNNLVNIQGKLNITADGASVKNLNVNNGSSTAGYIHAKDVLVEGCSVIGGNGFRYCYTDGTVTFKNSTITGSTYGIHFDGNAGGNIVIDNCVVTGWTSFAGTIENVAISKTTFANGNYNKLRLYQNATLTDCVFNENMSIDFGKNGTTADFSGCTVENDGNLLDVIYLADLAEMGIAVTVDGTPVKIVAKIGETYYVTLQAAVDAAQADDVISLIADVDLNSQVVISGKTLTLDLGEYTITDKSTVVLKSADDVWGLIDVENGANVTVRGNGSIECNYANVSGGWTGMAYAINVDATSKLTVEGGTFTNGNGCIQTCGTLVVNGGTFVSHNGGTCIMAEFESASVTVNDGIFKDTVDASDAYTGSGAVWAGFGATVEINGGTYNFAADPENNNVVWTLFPAQNAIAGYGENAKMTVKGGTFANFNPAADVVVDYSASAGFTMGGVVADECASLPDLNGNYVVGSKPTTTVNDLGAMTIAEADYTVYGGSKSGDMPLSFVMQFLADQTAEDMETSPYANWYGDFVITFEGLEGDFVADGCYLAGYYGSFGWVKVPVDGMTIEEGVRYPVMLGVGMGQKYDYICESVKDFRCALYLTPEVLAANPNIKVNLELSIVDNSKGEDAAAEALVNNTNVYQVGVTSYTAEDFAEPVAKIGDVEYKSLQAAIDAAQADETITVLRDVTLTEGVTIAADDEITLDLNGKTITTAEETEGKHYYAITNNGALIIKSSEEGGKIVARGNMNYGELTLEDNVTIDACDGNGGYGVRNYSGATFTMNGGAIVTSLEDDNKVNNGGYDATTLRVDNGATATINGGAINNICDYTFAIENAGTVTVTGGEVTSVHSTVSNNGTMTIEGGKFTCNGLEGVTAHALVAWDGSTTTINGGTFDGKDNYNGFNVDAAEGANVVITGGNFLAVHSGSLYGDGIIAVSGGTFFDEIADERCVAGYGPVLNSEGTYNVVWTGNVDELVIVDGELTEFVNEQEMTVGKLTYKRTLPNVVFNALYVPFEIPVEMLSDNFEVFYFNDVHSYDDDNDGAINRMTMEVFPITSGTLKANYPYLIRAKSTENRSMEIELSNATLYPAESNSVECSSVFMHFEVKGTYERMSSEDLTGSCVIGGKGSWITLGAGYYLNPFRLYLKMTAIDGSPVKVEENAMESIRIRVAGEYDSTDINRVEFGTKQTDGVYDLQGRRVVNPTRGFYIVNGKKVYIK